MKRMKTLAAVSLLAGAPLASHAIGHELLETGFTQQTAVRDNFTPGIDVKIDHGVLTLYGKVSSELELVEAENTALEMAGIIEVRNMLVCID